MQKNLPILSARNISQKQYLHDSIFKKRWGIRNSKKNSVGVFASQHAKGNPYTIWVKPETRVPVLYIKDAAQAMVQLAEAPLENIQTGIYLLDGAKPTPSAGELADVVMNKIPGAQIGFTPDEELQSIVESLRPLDDGNARREWGWHPAYDLERIVDDFLLELKRHPQRYH